MNSYKLFFICYPNFTNNTKSKIVKNFYQTSKFEVVWRVKKKKKKRVSIILKSRSQEYRRHVLFIWWHGARAGAVGCFHFKRFYARKHHMGILLGSLCRPMHVSQHRYPFCSSHVITFIIFIQRINGYLIGRVFIPWPISDSGNQRGLKSPFASSFSFYFKNYIYIYILLFIKKIKIKKSFCEFNNLVHAGVIN